jgi:hypothetical protein
MKKIILSILILVVVVIGGGVGYLAMNANSLIAKNKGELEKLASKAIGANVKLGDLSVSVFPSIQVNISEFSLSKNKSNEQLSLKNLKLNLSLTDLLFGAIKITNLSLSDPTITLIKDKKGIRVAGLPEASSEKKIQDGSAEAKAVQASDSPSRNSPLSVDLESLSITGLNVRFLNSITGKESPVSKVDISTGIKVKGNAVSVKGLSIAGSLLKTAKVDISGDINELGGEKEKLKLKAGASHLKLAEIKQLTDILETALPIEGDGSIKIKADISGSSKSPAVEGVVDLGDSRVVKPATFSKEAGTPLAVSFAMKSQGDKVSFSTSIVGDKLALVTPATSVSNINIGVQAQGEPKKNAFALSTDSLALVLGGAPIRGKIEADLMGAQMHLKTLHLDAFNGTVDGTARHNSSSTALGLDLNAATLDLGMILSALNPAVPAPFQGTLSSLNLNMNTALKTDPAKDLVGKGSLKMVNGKIVGSNIVGEVLTQLANLPFVGKDLISSMPASEKEALTKKDTDIQQLSASFTLASQRLTTPDLLLTSSLFSLTAIGSVEFDGNMDLKCKMTLNKALSSLMVTKVKELKTTLSPAGEMTLSVGIKGKSPGLVVNPDLGNLMKAGLMGAASKFLGGSNTPAQGANPQNNAPGGKNPLKKLLKF